MGIRENLLFSGLPSSRLGSLQGFSHAALTIVVPNTRDFTYKMTKAADNNNNEENRAGPSRINLSLRTTAAGRIKRALYLSNARQHRTHPSNNTNRAPVIPRARSMRQTTITTQTSLLSQNARSTAITDTSRACGSASPSAKAWPPTNPAHHHTRESNLMNAVRAHAVLPCAL